MKISNLIKNVNCKVFGSVNKNIENLSINSKKTAKNSLFFCISGTKTNGTIYISEAIKNGAVAIVCDKKMEFCTNATNKEHVKYINRITQIVVSDVRKSMAKICANFYDNPQDKLKIVGITGTNGKSSTAFLIFDILKMIGKKVGLIGTSGIYFNDKKIDLNMTTPESVDIFNIFKQMVNCGVEYCIMEVSAHAIFFDKIYGIDFAVKALTNIKSDHLDFFETRQNYIKVKRKFFESGNNFVINFDDKFGKEMARKYVDSTSYYFLVNTDECLKSFNGKKNNNLKNCKTLETNKLISKNVNNQKINKITCKNAKIYAKNIKYSLNGTQFDLFLNNESFYTKSNLIGKFNVQNMLCAIGVIHKLGLDYKKAISCLPSIKKVSGRFDCIYDKNFYVVIDYAHTTDSLRNFLKAVTQVSKSKNIIVFGSPGERDSYKRFQMGKLAGKYCDIVILTSDNPASENPRRIMFEISEGVKATNAKCYMIENRARAIYRAIKFAKKNYDYNILIVGKGVEEYQVVGDKHILYSDYDVVKNYLDA